MTPRAAAQIELVRRGTALTARTREWLLGEHDAAKDWNRGPMRPDSLADAQLMVRIHRRDERAFEELYRSYCTRLTRFLMNLIHRRHLVDEVINDTLLVVWDRPDSFHGNSKLSTWIFGIAYRKALKARRRQDEPIEDRQAERSISPEAGPDQKVGQLRVQEALLDALRALSPDHRTVVDLTYFHGIGYREIAEIMDCPVDTVKTRMFHARRKLKHLLAGELTDWLED